MAKKCAIIVQLGTPDSLEKGDLQSYLDEFLMDPGTIAIPYILRYMLVKWVIVPSRSRKVVERYRQIWDPQKGSPISYHSIDLVNKLSAKTVGDVVVKYAALYGNPKIEKVLHAALNEGFEEIRLIPMFPHETPATTDVIHRRLAAFNKKNKTDAKVIIAPCFYSNPDYVNLMAQRVIEAKWSEYEKTIFSFHGLPLKQIAYKSDSFGASNYMEACEKTAHLIAKEAGLKDENFLISYQSRFGKNWTGPQTEDVLSEIASAGHSVLVVSPSFTADCLETSWEIGISFKQKYIDQGGAKFEWIPSLNSDDDWVNVIFGWIQDK